MRQEVSSSQSLGTYCWWQIKCNITWAGSLCWNVGETWCLYLPVTSSLLYIFLFVVPYTTLSHSFTLQKVWKKPQKVSALLLFPQLVATRGVACGATLWTLLWQFYWCCFFLRAGLIPPAPWPISQNSSAKNCTNTTTGAALLVLRCCENSWLGGRNPGLRQSWLV